MNVHDHIIGLCDDDPIQEMRRSRKGSEWEKEVEDVLLELVLRTYGHDPHLPFLKTATGRIAKILDAIHSTALDSYPRISAVVQRILRVTTQPGQTLSVALVMDGLNSYVTVKHNNGLKRARHFRTWLKNDTLDSIRNYRKTVSTRAPLLY